MINHEGTDKHFDKLFPAFLLSDVSLQTPFSFDVELRLSPRLEGRAKLGSRCHKKLGHGSDVTQPLAAENRAMHTRVFLICRLVR